MLVAPVQMMVTALLLAGQGTPAPADGFSFTGSRDDPSLCATKEGVTRCCGGKKSHAGCGADFLHPFMQGLARCVVQELRVGGAPPKCQGGVSESFRTLAAQGSLRGLKPGWSLHNYGLAFDACCYYKSLDCSPGNLINKVVGGVKAWKSCDKKKCVARNGIKSGLKSKEVSALATGSADFALARQKVERCYEESGIEFKEWSWGVGWKDYFDAPHFQYYPSKEAGYYAGKADRKNGSNVLLAILADCYDGDRRAFLEELYGTPSPDGFVEKWRAGCGARAYEMYIEYKGSY